MLIDYQKARDALAEEVKNGSVSKYSNGCTSCVSGGGEGTVGSGTTPAGASSSPKNSIGESTYKDAGQPWLSMETAPRNNTIVRLLVEFEDNATDDGVGPFPTIGANGYDEDGTDEWKFAGWNWTHDCFAQGTGKPVGWMPLLETRLSPSLAAVCGGNGSAK